MITVVCRWEALWEQRLIFSIYIISHIQRCGHILSLYCWSKPSPGVSGAIRPLSSWGHWHRAGAVFSERAWTQVCSAVFLISLTRLWHRKPSHHARPITLRTDLRTVTPPGLPSPQPQLWRCCIHPPLPVLLFLNPLWPVASHSAPGSPVGTALSFHHSRQELTF